MLIAACNFTAFPILSSSFAIYLQTSFLGQSKGFVDCKGDIYHQNISHNLFLILPFLALYFLFCRGNASKC